MNKILFEWRLIIRNKRLSQMLIPMLFLTINYYLLLTPTNSILNESFIWRELYLVGLFSLGATYYGVLALGISASYIEKLMISPKPLSTTILQTKYYLYSIFSLIIALIIMLIPVHKTNSEEIISAYLFSTGFVYYIMFQCSPLCYDPIDIKATSFYNWQGFTFTNQFFPAILLLAIMTLIAIGHWFLEKKITLIIMSIVGIIFITTHKLWIKSISKRIKKNKYRRLECFREYKY